MRKTLIILLFCLTTLLLSCKEKQDLSELDTYLLKHDISINEIEPYFNYKRFNFYDFFDLENLRINNNYTYLETINYFYIKDDNALLLNTDLVLVNKQFSLTQSYKPNLINISDYPVKVMEQNIKIQKHVLLNYIQMINDLELYDLYIYSGYRSYSRQEEIYTSSTNKNYVAKPGHSEHQSGLVLDVSTLTHGLIDNFQFSMEYQILKENCMNYGFIIRYPESKEHITGYYFEPWHLRYVGRESSIYISKNNLTLEEYIFKNFEI
jgi:LAS superfamily LD-carboxypeptidase LdcB